jgi:hypothetical protein
MFDELKRIKSLKKEDIYFSRIVNAIFRRIYHLPHKFLYYLPLGFYRRNRNNLKSFNNIHKGERCFVIANGPSLKHIDFSLLENEFTIGMNRIYLMKNQNGFTPTYLACIDKNSQINQFYEEFDKLEMPCFFNFKLRHKFSKLSNQNFIFGKSSQSFAKGISNSYGNGKTVTYIAIQLAFHMGFNEVYLIGKDHNYNTVQKPGTAIKSDGNENNHFIKGYYKKGQNWDAPDLTGEESAYKIARNEFEKNGRIIRNATVGGELEIFKRIDYLSIFDRQQN